MIRITEDQKKQRAELLKPLTLKNVVMGRGHDCGGLIADVYLNKKKVAAYHDDGWGGEPEITYLKDGDKEKMLNFMEEIGFEKHLNETDWKDFKSPIGIHTSIDVAIEFVAVQMEEMKEIKKLQTKALVLKKDGQFYTKKFTKSIAQIKKNPRLEQQLKDIMKKEIAEGYEILNTNTPEI
jgi:hypothetical protein